jgi:hypothetical protein
MSWKSDVDIRLEEAAVECLTIGLPEGLKEIQLEGKVDLLKVRDIIKKPILHGPAKEYYFIDRNVYYYYKEH